MSTEEKISDEKPLLVDCPHCHGSGKVSAPHLETLAATAWAFHKGDELQLIKAIKTLRGWTGMSLRESKNAIENVAWEASK